MSTVRLRRLQADCDKLHDYVRRHPRVRLVQKVGDPPERYQLEYRVRSVRMVGGELQPVLNHLVELTLPLNYPRTPPQCRMLSPVFHPNIAPHAICVGDHWGAGESLESIVIRIGEMLAYQSYNVKSPLNGEAARWVEENRDKLPLDPVSLLPEEEGPGDTAKAAPSTRPAPVANPAPAASPAPAARPAPVANSTPSDLGRRAAAPAAAAVAENAAPAPTPPASPAASPAGTALPPTEHTSIRCPECGSRYKVSAAAQGRQVRCAKCGNVFLCQTGSSPEFDQRANTG